MCVCFFRIQPLIYLCFFVYYLCRYQCHFRFCFVSVDVLCRCFFSFTSQNTRHHMNDSHSAFETRTMLFRGKKISSITHHNLAEIVAHLQTITWYLGISNEALTMLRNWFEMKCQAFAIWWKQFTTEFRRNNNWNETEPHANWITFLQIGFNWFCHSFTVKINHFLRMEFN